MAIEMLAPVPTTDTHAALTAKGKAVTALLRFEQLWRGLAPEDRAYFTGSYSPCRYGLSSVPLSGQPPLSRVGE